MKFQIDDKVIFTQAADPNFGLVAQVVDPEFWADLWKKQEGVDAFPEFDPMFYCLVLIKNKSHLVIIHQCTLRKLEAWEIEEAPEDIIDEIIDDAKNIATCYEWGSSSLSSQNNIADNKAKLLAYIENLKRLAYH